MSATAKQVWETLSKINVNEHTAKKGKFTYLSWNQAWAFIMSEYPDSSFHFKDDIYHVGGSVEVWCEVTVEGVTREMFLAVTDGRNDPIDQPSCDHVANARMRCMVKCLALFGLGFYIYMGEGLPIDITPSVGYTDAHKEEFDALVSNDEAVGLEVFRITHGNDVYTALYNSGEKGEKVRLKNKCNELIKGAGEAVVQWGQQVAQMVEADDADGFHEYVADLNQIEKKLLTQQLNNEQLTIIKSWSK